MTEFFTRPGGYTDYAGAKFFGAIWDRKIATVSSPPSSVYCSVGGSE